jgi:hypothetical protein
VQCFIKREVIDPVSLDHMDILLLCGYVKELMRENKDKINDNTSKGS